MPQLTHALINDVFRGPVYGQHDIFTAQSWARFVRAHDLDLSRALFAEEDGRVIGTIAFAQRGEHAWLSVMGVLPAYRKRGHGRRLFGSAVESLRDSGVTSFEFEVVQRNEHARKMYESFGFHVTGELYVWARKARRVDDGLTYAKRSLSSVRTIARTPHACWQRDPIAVARAGASALIEVDGAYAYVGKRREAGLILDAGARDERAARALLAAVDERVPYDLTLLNEPAASPLTAALQESGWRIAEKQYHLSGLRNAKEPAKARNANAAIVT